MHHRESGNALHPFSSCHLLFSFFALITALMSAELLQTILLMSLLTLSSLTGHHLDPCLPLGFLHFSYFISPPPVPAVFKWMRTCGKQARRTAASLCHMYSLWKRSGDGEQSHKNTTGPRVQSHCVCFCGVCACRVSVLCLRAGNFKSGVQEN